MARGMLLYSFLDLCSLYSPQLRPHGSEMKIISCHLENFASYKTLDFDFQDQGLTLIHGATGSGKSTLCDAIPWILFGKTAKGGAVDEVLSWNGNSITEGTIHLDNDKIVSITRIRSPKANDLYYETMSLGRNRGKDLNDTQKLINTLLGLDVDLYLSGAYYHEFSQTAQFFTTTAKNRRSICEQLVDLSMPKNLQEKTASQAKELKAELTALEINQNRSLTSIDLLTDMSREEAARSSKWDLDRVIKHSSLMAKATNFDQDKALETISLKGKIRSLITISREYYDEAIFNLKDILPSPNVYCKECGNPKNSKDRERIMTQIRELETNKADNDRKLHEIRLYSKQLDAVETRINTYAEQIIELETEQNPHTQAVDNIKAALSTLLDEVNKLEENRLGLTTKLTDLDILGDVVSDFRGILIKNTILDIESQTNELLYTHFDAEIKIELLIDSDKLDVTIQKDGNAAVYTQLSKGQRCLLKLCFGVAVMKSVANHHGIRFSQIFFDEALSGLDEAFKSKAFRLLETLAVDYDSVFVVDHSEEFKAMFNNKFKVELINGQSQINQD